MGVSEGVKEVVLAMVRVLVAVVGQGAPVACGVAAIGACDGVEAVSAVAFAAVSADADTGGTDGVVAIDVYGVGGATEECLGFINNAGVAVIGIPADNVANDVHGKCHYILFIIYW